MTRLTTALLVALALALLTLTALSQTGPVQAASPPGSSTTTTDPAAPVDRLTSPALTAGTTYYVNAATGDDSRTLAEAQDPGTPWQTISHAAATVPAGVAGNPNTISVAAGTHDVLLGETFPITMSQAHVRLVGAGTGSTTVDGGGADDVLFIAAEGTHVEGFTFQNAAVAAIESSVGGFTVTQNAFNGVWRGVYVRMNVQHGGGTYIYGDMVVISNTFVVSYTAVDFSISFWDSAFAPADITLGETRVSGNQMSFAGSSTHYGIVYDLHARYLVDGQFTAGDVHLSHNQITGPFDDGIFVETYADDISGTTTLTAGSLNITSNQIQDGVGGDTSIEFYYYYYLGYFYGQATADIGDVNVRDNDITNAQYGVYTYLDSYRIYDDVVQTYGDVLVENNTMNGIAASAIYAYLELSGIYDNAQVIIGSTRIQDNTVVNATSGTYGILYETDMSGLEDNANLTTGAVYIQDNTVAGNLSYGISLNSSAEVLSGQASVDHGPRYVQNNVITAPLGIWLGYYSVGKSVISDTTTTIGPAYVLSNTLAGAATQNIRASFYHVAQNVVDNAVVDIGDMHIQANHMTGGAEGILVEHLLANVYQNIAASAGVTMPHYQVVNNVIAGADTGVRVQTVGPGVVKLVHNTVSRPTLGSGAGVKILTGTVHITNTIVASYTIGISNTGGMVSEDYTLFSGNTADTAGAVTSGGNSLVGDPAFVDPAAGDYHLQPASAARDAGVNAGVYFDRDGARRPSGPGFDIGAYEFPMASITIVISPTGGGTVTLDPAGGVYAEGTAVELAASPATDYAFVGWSGGASGSTTPLVVTVTQDLTITANFEQTQFWLYLPLGFKDY